MPTCCDQQMEAVISGEENPSYCACASCEAYAAELEDVGILLAGLEPPELPLGFETRMRAQFRLEAAPKLQSWWQRLALAGAASVAIFLFAVLLVPTDSLEVPRGHHVEATVQLASAQPVLGVDLRLELPEGIELLGDQGVRSLEWTTDLGPTAQRQQLALKASLPGRWELKLSAKVPSGEEVSESVWLEVTASDSGELTLQIEGSLQLHLAESTSAGGDHG